MLGCIQFYTDNRSVELKKTFLLLFCDQLELRQKLVHARFFSKFTIVTIGALRVNAPKILATISSDTTQIIFANLPSKKILLLPQKAFCYPTFQKKITTHHKTFGRPSLKIFYHSTPKRFLPPYLLNFFVTPAPPKYIWPPTYKISLPLYFTNP